MALCATATPGLVSFEDDEPPEPTVATEQGDLQARLDELGRSVAALERRLAFVESRLRVSPSDAGAERVEEEGDVGGSAVAAELDLGAGAALLGRTLLVLGGGYLIRALTEAGALPREMGVLLGLVYAALWIALARRSAAHNRRASATFHALGAGLVAYPLVWESTARFAILGPIAAAAVLTALAGGFLFVAWRQNLVTAAWIGVAGASGAGLALQVTTRAFEPPAVFLLLLGVAVLWLARARAWEGLAGAAALVADFAVLVVGTGALSKGANVDRRVALATLIALFVLYIGSFLSATLRKERRSGAFDMIQAGLVTLVGLGGAAWVAIEIGPAVTSSLGVAATAAGLAGYALILSHRLLSANRTSDFVLYSCLAWILTAAGVGITMALPPIGWCVLGVVAAILAGRATSASFEVHAVLFLLLAAIESGLVPQSIAALAASDYDALAPSSALHGIVVLAAAIAVLLPVGGATAPQRGWRRWMKTALAILILLGVGGLAVSALRPLILADGATVDAARLATVRTGTLALLTMITALVSRVERLRFSASLVYPLLVAGGLKLLVEDFFVESPRHLVLALPLYAAALIIAPRLRATDRSDLAESN